MNKNEQALFGRPIQLTTNSYDILTSLNPYLIEFTMKNIQAEIVHQKSLTTVKSLMRHCAYVYVSAEKKTIVLSNVSVMFPS